MALTREHIEVLSEIITSIEKKEKLSDEQIAKLYKKPFIQAEDKIIRKYFNETIIPNLSDEELFNLALSFISGQRKYFSQTALLRGSAWLSSDLYVACANRQQYKNPGIDKSPLMDVLNWHVYQDRLNDRQDPSKDKAKAAAGVIRFKLAPIPTSVSQQNLLETNELQKKAFLPSADEIKIIINDTVLGSEPNFEGYEFLPAKLSIEERMKAMRGSNIPVPKSEKKPNFQDLKKPVPVAQLKKTKQGFENDEPKKAESELKENAKEKEESNSKKSTNTQIEQELKEKSEKKEKPQTEAETIPEDLGAKLNYAKKVVQLKRECVSYQSYHIAMLEKSLHSYGRKFANAKREIDTYFVNYRSAKTSTDIDVVNNALKEIEKIHNKIKTNLSDKKQKESFELSFEKVKALQELMKASILSDALEKEKLIKFSDNFKDKKNIFLKSACPQDDKFVKNVKIILSIVTLGLATIPLAIYSKMTKGSGKFWERKDEGFVKKGEVIEKLSNSIKLVR